MDFKDKIIVVTGAARGIGLCIAENFIRKGGKIVLCDLDEKAVAQAAEKLGNGTLGVRANVTSADDIENLFAKTMETFGRVDVVVNNAGITRDTLLIRMSEKDWDMVLDINLKGAFLVSKTAAKIMMKQRSGRIVNISSVVGLSGNAGQANYSASKAGLIGLTKTAAKELAARGITVNAVAPGFIETEMTEKLSDAAKEMFLKNIAVKRAGTTDDIASAVMFLASDEASYITGQVLAVDGGLIS